MLSVAVVVAAIVVAAVVLVAAAVREAARTIDQAPVIRHGMAHYDCPVCAEARKAREAGQ